MGTHTLSTREPDAAALADARRGAPDEVQQLDEVLSANALEAIGQLEAVTDKSTLRDALRVLDKTTLSEFERAEIRKVIERRMGQL